MYVCVLRGCASVHVHAVGTHLQVAHSQSPVYSLQSMLPTELILILVPVRSRFVRISSALGHEIKIELSMGCLPTMRTTNVAQHMLLVSRESCVYILPMYAPMSKS